MTFRKKSLGILIIMLVALPLIAVSTQVAGQSVPDVTPTVSPLTEQAAPAATQTPTSTSEISALGSVEATSVMELYFQTSGTVNGIYAQVGDYVQAGEVLADLDASSAWNTYNQAVLNLESAQISMDELLAPPTDAELAVAEANIASAQASYSSAANSTTDDQIAQLQLKYQQAQDQLTALQTARANMSGTEEEISLQEAKIGAQSFNVEIARLQLEEAQTPNSSSLWSASVRIQQAQLQLEELQAGASQTEIDNAQLTIDRAQANVEDAQTALLKTQLVTPITGYVTAVNITAGDSVNTSTAVIEISDTSTLQMTVPVNELDIKKIAVGQNAVIELDALSSTEIQGTVDNVGWLSSTSSDGIVTYDVRVVLNTDDSRVRIGMTGEVTIITGSES